MKSGVSSLEKVQQISDQSTPNYQSALFKSKEWTLNTMKVEPSLRIKNGEQSGGRLQTIQESIVSLITLGNRPEPLQEEDKIKKAGGCKSLRQSTGKTKRKKYQKSFKTDAPSCQLQSYSAAPPLPEESPEKSAIPSELVETEILRGAKSAL